MTEPWLGHWDGCSIQWSEYCDCDPQNPINLSDDKGAADEALPAGTVDE